MKKIYIILILVAIAWVTFVTFTLTAGMSIFGGVGAIFILYLSIKDSTTVKKKKDDEIENNKQTTLNSHESVEV